jgi:hypothetical protein
MEKSDHGILSWESKQELCLQSVKKPRCYVIERVRTQRILYYTYCSCSLTVLLLCESCKRVKKTFFPAFNS